MKKLKLMFISLAFVNCSGAKDSEIKAGSTSSSNAKLIFDGKSAYKLAYGDKEMDDVKVSFVPQEETRSMQVKDLSDSGATELSESDYFPRFIVTAESGTLTCTSGAIAFMDSMELACSDSSAATTTDNAATNSATTTTKSTETAICATGNNPSNIDGAKYEIATSDGQLHVGLSAKPTSNGGGNLNNRYLKFKDSGGMFAGGFVVGGVKVTGTLDASNIGDNYTVYFSTDSQNVSYKIGTFSKVAADVVSGTGNDTIYRVNFAPNVCVAKFKSAAGLLSNGAGYIIVSK
ncbi:MAG: hypothetical protein WCI18_09510 [Pseudomonadota bacterium]